MISSKIYTNLFRVSIFGLAGIHISCGSEKKSEAELPNIIYILADDLGYGDLSCYGQEKFETPNIDRLASEGMRFMQHYSGSTVCAPSRSALLTGQNTGHTPIRGNRLYGPLLNWPLPDSTFTLATMLKSKGYATGIYGKWGLGFTEKGAPNDLGFDEFVGYYNQRRAHHYYIEYIWHNKEKIYFEDNVNGNRGTYTPEIMQDMMLDFIEENKDQPFFIYYANLIPHADLDVPDEYIQKYRGKFLPEVNYKGTDFGDEKFHQGPYRSQPESHAAFAGMINYLDDQVGELYDKLKELGLDKNTMIIITSDNGPHREGGADPDYFDSNGSFRGYKRDLYEGGIRVPMIVWYPEKVKANTISNHVSAFWDVMPTLADLTDAETPDNINGISFLPELLGKREQKKHEHLYWEFNERGGKVAILKGKWKFILLNSFDEHNRIFELYNLDDDPGEQVNLAADYPQIVEEMYSSIDDLRVESEEFEFAY